MTAKALRAYVDEVLDAHPFPGLAVAVTDRNGLIACETFGFASLEARTPVTEETSFEIGSIGKTFTAMILLQLAEGGEVELEAPVTAYLPWFEVRSGHAPITLSHLLTHTSGLMTGAELSGNSRYDVWALRETEVGFPPGARFLYSNVAYRTLGFVVEEVTGLAYEEVLRRRILEPLGLEATDPAVTSEGRHRLAVGYDRRYDDRPARRSDPWVPATWLETATGDGSLAAPVGDLAGFLRALLNGGRGVLSEQSFARMSTPAIEADDGWSYGYGLELRGRQIRHGGSMPGFGAIVLGDLDAGLGVAVTVNGLDEHDVTEVIAESVLALYRDGTAASAPDPLAVADAFEYEGAYAGRTGELRVRADGNRLVLGDTALEPRGPDRFFADRPDLAGFHLTFLREGDRVVAAAHGSDVYRRGGAGAPPAQAPPEEGSAYAGHYRAYNPWYSNFRVVLREGMLMLIFPWGLEQLLTPLGDGAFRVGDEWSPERVRFGAVVDGRALVADFSGERYYRLPG